MTTYFSSDSHFGHKNILRFSNRPFVDMLHMREELIRRWNEVVGPDDEVYHLGDFAFTDAKDATAIAKRLNGKKHLIWGNHDHKRYRKHAEFMAQWIWCKDLEQIEVDGIKVILCHYPLLTWNKSHRGSFHVHGHCHGSLPPDPGARRVDVGVDCWDYRPVSFAEVKKVMDAKVFVPIDHHGSSDEG